MAVSVNPPNARGAPLTPAPADLNPAKAFVVAAGAPKAVADVVLTPKPPNAAQLPPVPKLPAPVDFEAPATPNVQLDAAAAVKDGVTAAADPKAGAGAVPCLCLLAM